MTQEELFKVLVAHCKEYGFIFPSSEIYDGLAAVYDYGQMGFPDEGLNAGPLHWELGVLATGPPRESLDPLFLDCFPFVPVVLSPLKIINY